MAKNKVMYYAGVILSLLVGAWHFFVPYMFRWYSYIPHKYWNLIVGIDWTNLCFSLLLFGTSLLLLIWGKKIFDGNKEAITLYGFLTFVWIFRVFLALVEPWPLEPIAWAAYTQFVGALLVMALLLIPFIQLIVQEKKRKRSSK